MKVLIDADSLMYKAVYKLDDTEFIESKGLQHLSDDELPFALAEFAQDRLEKKINEILTAISDEESNIWISGVEIYITKCSAPLRKKINPNYKAHRKPNLIVNCLRDMYAFRSDAIYDDEFEADDLIADRARELGEYNCIIVTMDKDLKQIGGFIYDFYSHPDKRNEEGEVIESYPMRGLSYIPKKEANWFFAKQMLMGDSCDDVQGLPKVGEKTAEKILAGKESDFSLIRAVLKEYKRVHQENYMEQLMLNKRLLYLGR